MMTTLSNARCVIIPLLLCAAAAGCGRSRSCGRSPIHVKVTNDSSTELRDVQVQLTSGPKVHGVGTMKPKDSVVVEFPPGRGEASVVVSAQPVGGLPMRMTGGYLDHYVDSCEIRFRDLSGGGVKIEIESVL